jgi:hypothetical protein
MVAVLTGSAVHAADRRIFSIGDLPGSPARKNPPSLLRCRMAA